MGDDLYGEASLRNSVLKIRIGVVMFVEKEHTHSIVYNYQRND